jgi:hypothetical protein
MIIGKPELTRQVVIREPPDFLKRRRSMMMQQHWKQEYQALNKFIAAHPEMIITASEVSIPEMLRDEFYRRFDDIRRALVENRYPALPPEIDMLCENYCHIEREIKDLLGLDDILMPIDLISFLHNPKEGLLRAVYSRLFDLLQGKIPEEDFEKIAGEDLEVAAANLYRLGYERWSMLALIKLLDPDEAFFVDLDETDNFILRELKSICFGRQAHHATMRIPEFVLHSRKLDKYVAVKAPLAREISSYVVSFRPPVRPRKRTGDTSAVMDPRVLFLYFMPAQKDIPLVGDIYEGTRTSPDWIIEHMSGEELRDPGLLDQVRQHIEAMNPKGGTCMIFVGSCPETEMGIIPDFIYTVSAGFDQSKLQSFVDSCFCADASLA